MTEEIRTVQDMGTLEANTECGEGSIRLTNDFWLQNETWQLDVLNDWIDQLVDFYTTLKNEVYAEPHPNSELREEFFDAVPWEEKVAAINTLDEEPPPWDLEDYQPTYPELVDDPEGRN